MRSMKLQAIERTDNSAPIANKITFARQIYKKISLKPSKTLQNYNNKRILAKSQTSACRSLLAFIAVR